jgi:hypothetical protein
MRADKPAALKEVAQRPQPLGWRALAKGGEIWPKLCFDLVFGHPSKQLIVGRARWLGDASLRMFRDQPILFLAREQADRRLFIRRFHLRIDRR